MNVIVAKVYVKDVSKDDPDDFYDCVINTVFCVLMGDLNAYNDT